MERKGLVGSVRPVAMREAAIEHASAPPGGGRSFIASSCCAAADLEGMARATSEQQQQLWEPREHPFTSSSSHC